MTARAAAVAMFVDAPSRHTDEYRVLDSFPRFVGYFDVANYRRECLRLMRRWVAELMADQSDDPPAERYCLAYAEHFAVECLQRPLREPEKALLYSATRDVVNAWLALKNARAS